MTDRGYYNFYTPDEYESYQQFPPYNYGQTSEAKLEETMIKFMEMQQQQMQQMQDQNQQYLKNSLARAKNLENQLVQLAKQLANNNNHGETFQTNTQTTPDEKDNNPMKNEESGESVKGVENNEEERMFEGCGVKKIVKEIDTPHEVELPQELPCTEEANTVDKEQVMMAAEENEGLFSKEESCEQKKEMENKAEIDRVIEKICALFNKKELGRIWTPQHLYLKFMEFLPNRRKKTDDVLSASFWPP
ncbi:putative uncharacterized protein DDB_G0290989 [Trifolium pratense]|uniref:putative uncharacterized protein DDB_G0290989 n=1 Tax=Trifolium pratense TaxID=57577 RepID=UPI001E6961E6|nr:putative uncharacterized protein DDB_G0290989 [Trifolium pratense]